MITYKSDAHPSKLLAAKFVIPLWKNGLETQTITERLHIVEGSDWKDAVIALLEPRSPYRPWRYSFGEAHEGDPVAIVLNTDPSSVLTVVGRVGADGNPAQAVVDPSYPGYGLLDLATLVMVANLDHRADPRYAWQLRDDAAIRMELALTQSSFLDDPKMPTAHLRGCRQRDRHP